MKTRVQRWGKNLGIRIPRIAAMEARIEVGSVVEISVIEDGLFVRPLRQKRYRLVDLVKDIRPENVHGEVLTSEPVGREIW